MNDLSQTIAPRSDQMNADDLIVGPRTIRITRVSVDVGGEQPVALNFDGDGGKPYRPCKSMRRVLVALWGADGAAYAGRAMTLYRDENVQFGGLAVGGIRISHMSDIDAEKTLVLTATKKSRKPFTVRLLEAPKSEARPMRPVLKPDLTQVDVPDHVWRPAVKKAIDGIHDEDALDGWLAGMMKIVTDPEDEGAIRSMVADKRASLAEKTAAAA